MMNTILIFLFSFLGMPHQDAVEDLLQGKWNYVRGSYEYFDASNRKLKESSMNAISNLEIQLGRGNVAVISFSKAKSRTSTYSVSKDAGGKYFISADLSGNPFKYEIASINNNDLLLLSRTTTSFFIDGDVNKKVSYCLVKIYLERKPAGS